MVCFGALCSPKSPTQTGPLVAGGTPTLSCSYQIQHSPSISAETLQQVKTKKVYVIVNPHGGTKKGLAILEEVTKIWSEATIEVVVLRTEYAGHAKVFAKTVR